MRDRALVARASEAGEELLAIERLAAAVLLHDERQDLFDALVGREAARALLALATAPRDVARAETRESSPCSRGSSSTWTRGHGAVTLTGREPHLHDLPGEPSRRRAAEREHVRVVVLARSAR